MYINILKFGTSGCTGLYLAMKGVPILSMEFILIAIVLNAAIHIDRS